MQKNNFLRVAIILLIMIATVGCDQVTKSIVRQKVDYNENIKMLYNRVTLTKVENPGAFLSLGDHLSSSVRYVVLIALPLIVLFGAVIFLVRKRDMDTITLISLCIIIGGGIGNIYDRIVHGSVTDFLHIDFYIFQTGIFNVADLAVTTGMLMILFSSLLKKKEPEVVAE